MNASFTVSYIGFRVDTGKTELANNTNYKCRNLEFQVCGVLQNISKSATEKNRHKLEANSRNLYNDVPSQGA